MDSHTLHGASIWYAAAAAAKQGVGMTAINAILDAYGDQTPSDNKASAALTCLIHSLIASRYGGLDSTAAIIVAKQGFKQEKFRMPTVAYKDDADVTSMMALMSGARSTSLEEASKTTGLSAADAVKRSTELPEDPKALPGRTKTPIKREPAQDDA